MLVVMIPAFNEAATVGEVVRKVPRRIAGIDVVRVLVVDDGSDDGTGEGGRGTGTTLLTHPRNRGKGAALRAGIARLQSENAKLRAEIDSVRKSTYAVERIAREDLGMSKKGEVVYILPKAGR